MVARLMQGFSTGGEMGNATAFMREYAPEGRTGYYVSWVYASAVCSSHWARLSAPSSRTGSVPRDLETWGWRVPFLLGLLIGPVGYVLRTRIADPPAHRQTHEPSGTPFRDVITKHPKEAFAVGRADHAVHDLHLHAADLYAGLCGAGAAFAAIRRFHRDDGRHDHRRRADPRVGTLRRSVWARDGSCAPHRCCCSCWPVRCSRWSTRSPSLATLLIYQLVFGVVIAMYQGPILTRNRRHVS